MTLLALAVGLASLRVLSFDPTVIDEVLRPNLIAHPIQFYVHVILGPVALLVGTWQFLPITRRSRYHRLAGRLYVACCLIAGVAGFIAAFTTTSGPATGSGFMILAVLWFGATLRGYLAGRARDTKTHQRWMIRSYALTCAAVTLRVILGVGLASNFPFADVYFVAAWASWIVNLALAEAIIRWPHTRAFRAAATA